MDWEFAKGVAAIWGASLSTWLAIVKLLEVRPIITFEAFRSSALEETAYRLRVSNPSKFPILIKRVRQLLPCSKSAICAHMEHWEIRDELTQSYTQRLDTFVPSGTEVVVNLVMEEDLPQRLLLEISWSRHQPIILPTMPKFLYRTRGQLDALRQHPLTEDDLK